MNVLQELGSGGAPLPIPLKQAVLPRPLDDLEGEKGSGSGSQPTFGLGRQVDCGGQPWALPCALPPTTKRCRGPHHRARNCSDVVFLMLRKQRAPQPTRCRARDCVLPPCALREAPRAACHPRGPCTSGHREPRSPPGSGAGGSGMEPTDCHDPN